MPLWYTINPSHFRMPINEKIGGATVVSSTSPYAVPDAVATYGDPHKGIYIFEVKYIGPEEPEEAILEGHVLLWRGKNSKRLFKVGITNQPGLERSRIFEVIKDAIVHVSRTRSWPIANEAIVGAVIDENKDRLPVQFDVPLSGMLGLRGDLR